MSGTTTKKDKLEERVVVSELLRVYGALLSPRQRDCIDRHFNEDLTLAEIAETHEITRQAVYDAIRQGRKSLNKMEDALAIVRRGDGGGSELVAGDSGSLVDTSKALELVERMKDHLKQDILYDTDPLRRLVTRLEKLLVADGGRDDV